MKISIYLYLAVILLNSCSEQINPDPSLIEQMIILEEQIQRMNIVQTDRGFGYLNNIKEELISSRGSDLAAKRAKLEHILLNMEKINTESGSLIKYLDDLKIELLSSSGENTQAIKDNDPNTLIWQKNDPSDALRPMRLNLCALKNRKDNETAQKLFIGSNLETPSATGLELWDKLNNYRKNLISITGSYKIYEKEFSVNPADINDFTTSVELYNKVHSMLMNQKGINKYEDVEVLTDLYLQLTKQERLTYHGKNNVHWICATFNDANIVGAISAITSLQQEILSARAHALATYSSKVSSCNYSFDKILPVAFGPSTVHLGEQIEFQVIMAAIDSYQTPLVKTNHNNATIQYPGNGSGIISLTPTKKGQQKIKGTITVKNKAGIEKTEEWEYVIEVLQNRDK